MGVGGRGGVGNFTRWVQRGEAGRARVSGETPVSAFCAWGLLGSCKVKQFEKRQIRFAPLALKAVQGQKRQVPFPQEATVLSSISLCQLLCSAAWIPERS